MTDAYLAAYPPHSRKMTPEEVKAVSYWRNFFPTHPLFNPKKLGKTRVAVYLGTSLNKNPATEPDQLNSLQRILLRFRNRRLMLAAYIEAMFYQVSVRRKDTDALRFLWKDEILFWKNKAFPNT